MYDFELESSLDRIQDQLYGNLYQRLRYIEIEREETEQCEAHIYDGTEAAIRNQPGVKRMVKFCCKSFIPQQLRNDERSCPCTCPSRLQIEHLRNVITRSSIGTAIETMLVLTKDHPCGKEQWKVLFPLGYLEIADSEARVEDPEQENLSWEDWCNRYNIPIITRFKFDDDSKYLYIRKRETLISNAEDPEAPDTDIELPDDITEIIERPQRIFFEEVPEPNRIAVRTNWRSVDEEMHVGVKANEEMMKLPEAEACSAFREHLEQRWGSLTDRAFKRIPSLTNQLLETVNSADWPSRSELVRNDCKRRGLDVIRTLNSQDLTKSQFDLYLDTAYHPQLGQIMYSGCIQPHRTDEATKFQKRFLPDQPFSYIPHDMGNTATSEEAQWTSSPAACEILPHSKNSYEKGDEDRTTRECVRRKASRQIQKTLDQMYTRHHELPSTIHRYDWNARTTPLREKLTRDVYRSIDEILKPESFFHSDHRGNSDQDPGHEVMDCRSGTSSTPDPQDANMDFDSSQQSETKGPSVPSSRTQDKEWHSEIVTPRTVTLRLRPEIDTKLQKVRCEGDIESLYEDDYIFKSTFGDKVEPASYAAYMRYLEDVDGVQLEEED